MQRFKIQITRERLFMLLEGKPFALKIPAGAEVIEFHLANNVKPPARLEIKFGK